MDKSLMLSIVAIVISAFSLFNSWKARRSSKKESLYNLRKDALLKATELANEWQKVLNELNYFEQSIKFKDASSIRKDEVSKYIKSLDSVFTESLKNAKGIKNTIEKEFDQFPENDAKRLIATFQGRLVTLKTNRKEMMRKMRLFFPGEKFEDS